MADWKHWQRIKILYKYSKRDWHKMTEEEWRMNEELIINIEYEGEWNEMSKQAKAKMNLLFCNDVIMIIFAFAKRWKHQISNKRKKIMSKIQRNYKKEN